MIQEFGQDSELLDRFRASFAAATLSTPLSAIIQRGRQRRTRRRITRLSGAVVLAVGAALAVPLLLNSGPTTVPGEKLAAWTVTRQPGGLVLVTVSQLRDPAGLQRALRADGIPAAVRFQAAGQMSLTPPLPRGCGDIGLSPQADAALQEKILPNPMTGMHKVGPDVSAGTPVYPMNDALIIRPAAIPAGIGLNITVDWAPRSWGWSLGLVKASPQCTG